MLHIGIRYCGGCNPQYDRVKAVENLKASFPEVRWDYIGSDSNDRYDLILAVTGCLKECITAEKLQGYGTRILRINQKDAAAAVKAEIEKILGSG